MFCRHSTPIASTGVLALILVMACAQSALFGQLDGKSDSKTSKNQVAPFAASPLSSFQSDKIQARNKLNEAMQIARGHLPAPPTWDGRNALVTESIDLASTIARYAKIKQVSEMDARLETLAFLGIAPKKQSKRESLDGPTFEIDGVDVFKITADATFFKTLPYMLTSLEHGKVEIEIQVKIIEIDSRLSNRINRYMQPGSEKVVCSRLPIVSPTATDNFDVDAKPFVSTTSVVRQNLPVTLGSVTKANLKKLEAMLNSDPNCEIVSAPSLRLYPGQVGIFSDAALRPYVVGLAGTKKESGISGTQPVVQPVEDGTTIRLRAIPRGTETQLFGDIAISEVLGVKTLTYTSGELKSSQSVQIPTQKIQQLHFSATLERGQSIMIDPNFYRTPEPNDRRGKNATRKLKTLLLFRTSVKEPN